MTLVNLQLTCSVICGKIRFFLQQHISTHFVWKASFRSSILRTPFLFWFAMKFIDILSLILSFLGFYGIVYSLRLLLPRNIVPHVSTSLNEAMVLLEHAHVPNVNDYRANLAMCARVCIHNRPLTKPSLHNQFLQMRTESHRSPGFCQQFCLLFLCGLTWRLYGLKSQIETIRRKIEV